MLITDPSVSALAFIAIFASPAIAVTNSTVERLSTNSTLGRLSKQSLYNATVYAEPGPTDPPNFNTDFKLTFDGGRCTDSQKAIILGTVKNVGALARRGGLWENDAFHDWDDEVNYWFGPTGTNNYKWIHNNFLRLEMAARMGKSAWIKTWVYASCDSAPSGRSYLKCDKTTGVFNNANNYGYFRYWDTIYWNFCPNFFYKQDIATKIKATINDGGKNTHFMENYYDTREQWLFPGFFSIRSIGIAKMINWDYNVQTPGTVRYMALEPDAIYKTARNYMSYFYTTMSITIPESFNWGSRPVVSQQFVGAWSDTSDSDNSDGTVLPYAHVGLGPDQDPATTDTFFTESTTVAPTASTVTFASIDDVTFTSLIDTAHTSTENCFTFFPSSSVQGSVTERCDCGTTTAALTTQGASTGCALSNSIFAINQFPTETVFPIASLPRPEIPPTSTSSTPSTTTPPPIPTRAFEIMFKNGDVDGITLDAWSVYSHSVGQESKINACNGGFWWLSASPTVQNPTSLGSFTGNVYSGCHYQGPTAAPGSVSCPGMATWTACSKAPASTQVCDNGAGFDVFYAQVECVF